MNLYISGQRFPTNFCHQDTTRRERHGLIWTEKELSRLRKLYHQNASLKDMCEELQRPADGVVSKLRAEGLVMFSNGSDYCNVTADASKESQAMTPSNQEKLMGDATKTIEKVVRINGQDASTLSDEQIFHLIAKLEAKADQYEKIQAKPKRLQEAIEKIRKDVLELGDYVDSRSEFGKGHKDALEIDAYLDSHKK